MRTLKRVMVLLIVTWLAAGCTNLPASPSYVPSPFDDWHGQ